MRASTDAVMDQSYHQTGEGKDSSKTVMYPHRYVRLEATDLKVFDLSISSTDESASDLISLDNSTKTFRFSLQTANQAGLSFQILLTLNYPASYSIPNIVLQSRYTPPGHTFGIKAPFRLDPYKLVAGFGTSVFSRGNFPTVVKLDGSSSNTLNIDGLPSPLKILVTDINGVTTGHANCNNCVSARLVQCTDSTYLTQDCAKENEICKCEGSVRFGQTDSDSWSAFQAVSGSILCSAAIFGDPQFGGVKKCQCRIPADRTYPLCSSTAQAKCATSSADGSKCAASSDYLDTLRGTTVANVVNGTATFTDIQVQYVAGAGYRLQFVLNALDIGLMNGGSLCHLECGFPQQKQGPCSFCGTGLCCRYGWFDTSNGCDATISNPQFGYGHRCQASVGANGTWPSRGLELVSLNRICVAARSVQCTDSVYITTDCASENKICECKGGSVRYGSSIVDRWSAFRVVSGSILCSVEIFGDPALWWHKKCQCRIPVNSTIPHITVPDDSYSTAGKNNSFYIFPYSLSIVQDVGGDGVDMNADGVPDGVGSDHIFRVQPAVAIKGINYNFSKDWGQHGYMSVTATIKHGSCGGDCSNSSLKLQGTLTPVSPIASTFTAAQDQSDTSALLSGALTQLRYRAELGEVGMVWRDLKVTTANNQAQLGIQLSYQTEGTSISSSVFDAFGPPEAPVNLRVYSYDTLGFRVEFDPGDISRAKPLSGFTIEVDRCSSSTTSCSVMSSTNDLSEYNLATSLGTDYSHGGGHTEEVLLSYSAVSAGNPSELSFSFKPSLALSPGDRITFDLGYPGVLFHRFNSACTLTGSDAHKLLITVDSTRSRVTLQVKQGYMLWPDNPVSAMIPVTCNFLLPDGENHHYMTRYGSEFLSPPLPKMVVAAILGEASSARFDNCKGNLSCAIASGETVSLPSIQDGNSMDTSWSGNLRRGGIGQPCAACIINNASSFPANRFCTLDSPNSNDPDLSDDSSVIGNSGHNGRPIAWTASIDTDPEACLAGLPTSNPCSLPIGQDWKMGVNITYLTEATNVYVTAAEVQFKRDRSLKPGDVIKVPFVESNGVVHAGESCWSNCNSQQGPCSWCGTGLCCRYGWSDTSNGCDGSMGISGLEHVCSASVTCGIIGGTSLNGSRCTLAVSLIHIDFTPFASIVDWNATWDTGSKLLAISVGSHILRGSSVVVKFTGMNVSATLVSFAHYSEASPVLSSNSIAQVMRGSRTTIIFKNGAQKASFSSSAGDPLGSYVQSGIGGVWITAGSIYQVRVYAYNGRFVSDTTSSTVHNRAIKAPQKVAYFPQMTQRTVGTKLECDNLPEVQFSQPTVGIERPAVAIAGGVTRIGISFTPDKDIEEAQTITLKLPGFKLANYAVLDNANNLLLLANKYTVVGNSSACACGVGGHPPFHAGGTIITPPNLYATVRTASGPGSCSYSGNQTVPWCACGDGSCTSSGVADTPATVYNTSGNCSRCECSADGVALYPPTTYNASSDCSSCQCSAAGVPTYSPFVATGGTACSNCTCSGAGVSAAPTFPGVSCSACSCKACSCSCIPNACHCACPIFRSCSISCEIEKRYFCRCTQNTAHPSIARVSWSGMEESLVLTVATGKVLKGHEAQYLWISSQAGFKYPTSGVVSTASDSVSTVFEARLTEFELRLVSPFPTPSQPRLGYVVQFTSDLFWKRHIQTVFFKEILDGGIFKMFPATHLTSALTSTNTEISVGLSNPDALTGRVIQVNNEQMLVRAVETSKLHVLRGYAGTSSSSHPQVSGGVSCVCHSNGTSSGGASCACTAVRLVLSGVTQSIDSDITGYEGTACRTAVSPDEGCNPIGVLYPGQLRTHQVATLRNGNMAKVLSFSACGARVDSCDVSCICQSTGSISGVEFGNIITGGDISIFSTGIPFDYPIDYRTNLDTAVSASLQTTNIIVKSALNLVGKYIRINDEILFVKSSHRGVRSVSTFKAYPQGGSCYCSSAGTPSASSCTCVGSAGANCRSGGELIAKEAGTGFSGTFTISGGSINSITVTNPGTFAGSSPNIIIHSGGTGCEGITLYPSLSENILSVVRGSLGSTVSSHIAGAKVSTVLWASQYDPKRPGKRYNFRIAAYNNAGLSEWLYYDLKLYDVFPRNLASQGNIPMEIVLVGAGITSANYTVYIGHTLPDGKIDLDRSKVCTGLMVLDNAGTKLSARSPAWVGKAHDLIVHYRSGMFEHFVVGNNWIRYDPPSVSTVIPALLDNWAVVNVTVMGANFGNNKSDVLGYLDGASNLPCTPFNLVNNGLGICTLIPAKDDILTGNIIVIAGSDWSGGAQQSSPRLSNYVKEKPLPVEVEVSLPIEISSIPEGSPEREALLASFIADVSTALGVPSWRISIIEIRAGSVIIIFVILPDSSSVSALTPAALAANLAQQAADPNSALSKTSTGNSITVSVPSNLAAVLLAESVVSSATASSSKSKKKVALNIDYKDPNRLKKWEKWQSTANLH